MIKRYQNINDNRTFYQNLRSFNQSPTTKPLDPRKKRKRIYQTPVKDKITPLWKKNSRKIYLAN